MSTKAQQHGTAVGVSVRRARAADCEPQVTHWDDEDLDIGSEAQQQAESSQEAADPAVIVARRLLGRLLDIPEAAELIGMQGLALGLVLPERSWGEPVLELWPEFLFPEGQVQPLSLLNYRRYARERRVKEATLVHVWAHQARRSGSSMRDGLIPELETSLLDALENRENILILFDESSHEEQSRSVFGAVLDRVLTLPIPNADDLVAAAEELYGAISRPVAMPDDIIGLMTAEVLRLAKRDLMDTAGYIDRVGLITRAAYVDVPDKLKRKPKMTAPKKPKARWTLENLHGMGEATHWGLQMCRDLRAYKTGGLDWDDLDRGVLLYGPPGCGKTTFAQAFAASADIPLIATSYGEWQSAGKEGHLGEVMKAIRSTFDRARKQAPCILFIDELDSVQSRGGTSRHDDWWTAIINCLLAELDGLEGREGVVVVGATNFVERVDPAIRRAGRLDRVIRISLPDETGLQAILREHLGDQACDGLAPIARRLIGRSGADCEQLVRSARRLAREAGRPVQESDLLDVIRQAQPERTREELWDTAIHEAGHALVAHLLTPGALKGVSIFGSGHALGAAMVDIKAQTGRGDLLDLEGMIQVLLAGRVAEILIFGRARIGSGGPPNSDLGLATIFSASIEIEWGVGDMGMSWRGQVTADNLQSLMLMNRELAERVESRLQKMHEKAEVLLRKNMPSLLAIAKTLVKREVLSVEEVSGIVTKAAIQVVETADGADVAVH